MSIASFEQMARLLLMPHAARLCLVPVQDAPEMALPPQIMRAAKRRQRSFAAGRMAARRAFAEAGVACADLGIGEDQLPLWPNGWIGCISHTDAIAAAIVMPDAGGVMGLDVERLQTAQVAHDISAAILPEATWPPGMAFEVAITCAFSAKEALYKALYPQTRQFREFSAARIEWLAPPGGQSAAARLILTEDWGAGWHAGAELEVHQTIAQDHVLSIVWCEDLREYA